jgi:hypothetical protein
MTGLVILLKKVQIIKTVRLGMEVIIQMMNDVTFAEHTKIVYLIRDPRAVINTRQQRKWPDLMKLNLCPNLIKDYRAAQELIRVHGDKIK